MIKTPSTPPGTPPESPTLTTAPADTTAHRREEHLLRDDSSSSCSSHKIKEMFRMKVSLRIIDEESSVAKKLKLSRLVNKLGLVWSMLLNNNPKQIYMLIVLKPCFYDLLV